MKYQGACHCKKVSYEVDLEIDKVISCNCSHCQVKGLLLVFSKADAFTLLSGEHDLTSYMFNKKVINHLFCKYCGVQSFSRGKNKEGEDTVAINVRCLEGVDVDTLTLMKVDGKSW
jgi:hypothetical protein